MLLRATPLLALTLCGCPDQSLKALNAEPEAAITSHDAGDEVLEREPVQLRGVVSDPDHSADQLSTRWYKGSQLLCDDATPDQDGATHCEAVFDAGQAEVILEVRDPQNAAASAHLALTVLATEAPLATILDPSSGERFYEDQLISFAGQVSDEEDTSELLTAWWTSSLDGDLELASDIDAQGQLSGEAYLSQGEHSVALWVQDSSGKQGSDSVLLEVGPPNSDPSCAITAPESGSAGEEGVLVSFTAQVADADISADQLTAVWSSDWDGQLTESSPTSDGQVSFSTSDLSVNTHTITLAVADEMGASCSDQVVYTVGAAPEVSLSSPSTGDIYNQGETISFAAQVSDQEDAATDLSLSWLTDLDGEISTQGADSNGQASFASDALSVGSHVLTLTVTDSHGLWGQAIVSFTVNGLPSAPTVSIGPDPAYTDDNLAVSIDSDAVDPDSDPLSYVYAWYQDGVLSTASSSASLASSATGKGETWSVLVSADDGYGQGEAGEASLTVSNSPPVLASVALTPDPATVEDTLTCTPGSSSDADNDSVSTSSAWDVSGSVHSGLGDSLDASYFSRGDTVSCTVTPNDGEEDGAAVSSNTVTIDNALPSISAVSIAPDPAYAGDTLVCSYSGFSDADGDADSSTYAWQQGGATVGSGASYSGSFMRGDSLTCTVTPDDGTDTGTPVSASITISNTAPSISTVTISPDPATAGDILSCGYSGYSDADGDADSSTYAWTIDGASAGSGAALSAGYAKDDVITCTVTPYDGNDTGTAVADSLVIDNALPSVSAVSIAPASPATDDTLVASASFSDADGDAVNGSYEWTVDGSFAASGSASLSGTLYFDKHQTVTVTVTPDDGDEQGSSLSASVTVVNTPPEAPGISIDPSAPAAGVDDLVCVVDDESHDDDGDSIDYASSWTVDGTAYPDGADTGDTGLPWVGPDSTTWPDDTVPAEDTAAGEVWTCTVTPDDGDDTGTAASTSVTLGEEVSDYSGTWTLSSRISYTCAYGFVNVGFSTVDIVDSYPTIWVAGGSSQPGTMTGSFTTSTSFSASNVLTGTCTETYTFAGSFEADFTGGMWGFDCSYQSWIVTATR